MRKFVLSAAESREQRIRRHPLSGVVCSVLFVLGLASTANAGTIEISFASAGTLYREPGDIISAVNDGNVGRVGDIEARTFLAFDTTAVTENVVAASLRLSIVNYSSANSNLLLNVYDLGAPSLPLPQTIETFESAGPASDFLGLQSASGIGDVTLDFQGSSIDRINLIRQQSGSLHSIGITRFTFSSGDGMVQIGDATLTLETAAVPEPSTALLLGLGLVGIAARRRSLG